MKVISDINIICVNQKVREIYNDKNILVKCKKNPCKFYGDEWKILTMLNGYWHQIVPINRELYSKYDDEFFNLIAIKNQCYISIDNNTYFNVNFVYDLLKFYLHNTPTNTICVLFRLNFQKKHKIKGIIKFKDFIRQLENNKILFDTAYIIKL